MHDTATELEERGFAIRDGVFSSEEMLQIADRLERSNLKRSKAGIRHLLNNGAIADLAVDTRLLNLAQRILGPEAIPFHATLFDKSAEVNWLVVWHQDTALPLREKCETHGWGPWSVKAGVIYAHAPASALCQVLTLRIHLDDSKLENGPLRVLPKTHQKGVMSDDNIAHLAAQIAPISCVVRQGGVLAMRPLIVHASSKSRSEIPRRVIHIEYAASRTFSPGLELTIA